MGTLRFGNFEGGSVVDPYRRAITKCSVSEGRWARHVVPLRPGRGPWLPRSRADGVLALERFVFIGQQDVHIFEDQLNISGPAIVRIIVGIERGSKPGFFGLAKWIDHGRPQTFV